MRKEIYVLTTNFPYGLGEAFLETEARFLSDSFDCVHYVPLWKNEGVRQLPRNSVVEQPLLDFNPKGNFRLVVKGLFCLSPFCFAIPVFFKEKAWKGKRRFWDFMTAFLLIRACYASLKLDLKGKLVYSYWGDKSALLMPLLKKKFGVTGVSRFHGTDLYEEACGGYKPFRRWFLPSLDLAMPISEDGKRYLLERYGENVPKRIEVHRLGVFGHGLNHEAEDSVFQIVSCSHIVPVKRVAFLAEVIGSLGFKVKWTHIGDGPLRADVESVIEKFPENVEGVLLGAMPNTEVLKYYSTHHVDLFVNVSESEGVPVSIMEALSFGIPVMATDVGGVSEIVDDSVGKLLPVEIGVQQLASYITTFSLRQENGKTRDDALHRWEERCDADRNYEKTCLTLLELMNQE